MEKMRFEGKVVIVTGASSDIFILVGSTSLVYNP